MRGGGDIVEPKTEYAILRKKGRSPEGGRLRRVNKKQGSAELQGNEPGRDVIGIRYPFRMLLIAISFRQYRSFSASATSHPAKRNGHYGAGSPKLDTEIKLKWLHFVALRFAFE